MTVRVVEFEHTPNPNAMKCVLDRAVSSERESFFRSEDAEHHPLARSLFAIEGVLNVMMMHDWVTVGKSPESSWRALKPRIIRALAELS